MEIYNVIHIYSIYEYNFVVHGRLSKLFTYRSENKGEKTFVEEL